MEMTRVTVRLFGPLVDIAGTDTLEYALVPPASIADLRELLRARYPRLESSRHLRFAVNEEYAEPDHVLREGDVVALIPPVSGGDDMLVRLTCEPISADALAARVQRPDLGGIVTFAGVVRAEGSADNPLIALEYSAYETMAIRQMQELRRAALQRFEIGEAALAHRLGRIPIGETAVAIAVGAPHRNAAFDACRWLIDTLKRDVPIWKREVWQKSEPTWVEGTC